MSDKIKVDMNGNAIKPKKNQSKKFAKPVAKKASGAKPKSMTGVMEKKPVRKIVGFYYFINQDVNCRDLLAATGEFDPKSDIWPDLNLMEVVMQYDSLIFQDATECFIDPEDLKWFEEQGIKTKYDISFDTGDITEVRKVMKNIMTKLGGIICSDTDDFKPSYTLDTLDALKG